MKRRQTILVLSALGISALGLGGGSGAGLAETGTAPPKTGGESRQEGLAASPAPVLLLTSELEWEPVYAGDPLAVTVLLASPRAWEEVERLVGTVEAGKKLAAPGFTPPAVSPQGFASRIALTLFRFRPDGSREVVLPAAEWERFRIPEDPDVRVPALELDVLALMAEWMVPPQLMDRLGPGRYALEVAWLGKESVDRSLLDKDGRLQAEMLQFQIKPPTNNRERAAHEERLAVFEFYQGRYQEARAHGERALALDRESFNPERVETYHLIANAAILLGDYKSAIAIYRELLRRLPPPAANDLAAVVSRRVRILEQMK